MKTKITAVLLSAVGIAFLGGGLALAAPDQIQAARMRVSIGVVTAGQALVLSGRQLIGLDVRDQASATLTYAAGNAIDFDPALASTRVLVATGDIVLTATNLAAGRTVDVFITASGGSRNITMPASSVAIGSAAPTSIASGKTAKLTFTSTTTLAGGLVYQFAVQP